MVNDGGADAVGLDRKSCLAFFPSLPIPEQGQELMRFVSKVKPSQPGKQTGWQAAAMETATATVAEAAAANA